MYKNPICAVCYNKLYKKKVQCYFCGEIRTISKNHNNKPMCYKCYRKDRRKNNKENYIPKIEKCSKCNKSKKVHSRCNNGLPLYSMCHERPKKLCSMCGEIEIITKTKDGKNICKKCYKPPLKECSRCKNIKIVAYNHPKEGPICGKCNKEKCSICGKTKLVQKRQNEKILCRECCKETCSICGKLKYVKKRNKDGTMVCGTCHKSPKKYCSICGKLGRVNKLDKNKNPVCAKCYRKTHKELCIKCGKIKEICIRDCNKNVICGPCYMALRKKSDSIYSITLNIRKRIGEAFRTYSKNGKIKSSSKYGINFKAICKHLDMCPGKREEYHIDHIFPLCAFDFDNPIHVKAAFAPENHQWLKAEENMQKGSKYNQKEFDEYIQRFKEKKDE